MPPFFGKPNTHNICQNNTIAIMPTNNNNTDNNKGKEVEKQTNRRSPRFSGSGDIAGNVISPDGAADGLSGTSGKQ